ncbi:hypothetical protein [uncultured Methanolobus sp.]|uniref:hypothetical protein n=1 Tax=uncultured Methanolobus sp. TaxID=218300 RepID=UPI003747AFDD
MEVKYQVTKLRKKFILSWIKDQNAPYSRAIAMLFGFLNSIHEDVAVSVDANC